MEPRVRCHISNCLLVKPVTAPDGNTYSLETATEWLQRQSIFPGGGMLVQGESFFKNVLAEQRVQRVREKLHVEWTPEKLRTLPKEKLAELIVDSCDETIAERCLQLDCKELVSEVAKQAKKRKVIKVVCQFKAFRDFFCMFCGGEMKGVMCKFESTCGHLSCALQKKLSNKTFTATVVTDKFGKRACEAFLLHEAGFLCMEKDIGKRAQWKKDLCQAIQKKAGISDSSEIWINPDGCDIAIVGATATSESVCDLWLVHPHDESTIRNVICMGLKPVCVVVYPRINEQACKEIESACRWASLSKHKVSPNTLQVAETLRRIK